MLLRLLPLLAVAALATGSAPLPRLLSCSGKPLLRPTGLVVLSCGDANSEIEDGRAVVTYVLHGKTRTFTPYPPTTPLP